MCEGINYLLSILGGLTYLENMMTTLKALEAQQSDAIACENYELAGQLKQQIESLSRQAPTPTIGDTETLYQQNDEVFTKEKHDTVAAGWEHKGKVSEISSVESDILGAFPCEVEKVQLQNPATGSPSNHFCLVYDGKELPVSVKKNYVPHSRNDIVTLCDAAKEAFGGQIKIATTFKDGHFVSIQPTDQYRRSIFGTDTINPRMIIQAKCGGGAFRASLGWYRDVCRNLTWLKSVAVVSESIRHSANLPQKHAELVETFGIVANGWENTVEYLKVMDDRQVRVSAVLAELMGERPDKGRAQTIFDRKVSAIDSILVKERMKTGKSGRPATEATAWELFNAIQGYSQHQKTRHGNPTEIERAAIAGSDLEVSKAEQLLFADTLKPELCLV